MATSHHTLSFLWPLLKGLLVIYAVLVGTVYLLQRKLQYFPDADPVPLPRGQEFRGLQTVELVSEDGNRSLSWYWPGEKPLTLVYFGGNGGNRADRLDWARDFHRLGYGLLLLDYRGYGGNPGTPTETGLYRDAQAALDWLGRESDRHWRTLENRWGPASRWRWRLESRRPGSSFNRVFLRRWMWVNPGIPFCLWVF